MKRLLIITALLFLAACNPNGSKDPNKPTPATTTLNQIYYYCVEGYVYGITYINANDNRTAVAFPIFDEDGVPKKCGK